MKRKIVKKKAAAKKAVVKKTVKKLTAIFPDFSKVVRGSKITGTIKGKKFEGRLQKEDDDWFICQNVANGDEAFDKLGYKYSWNIGRGDKLDLRINQAVIHSVRRDYKFKPPEQINIGRYTAVFTKGSLKVGCTVIPNKLVREIASKLID